MEVFTEVTSGNFIEQYFFVFMRSVTTVGEFPLRNIYNKIKENKAIWRIENGRWRTHELDGTISYLITGDKLMVSEKYYDGTINNFNFTLSEL